MFQRHKGNNNFGFINKSSFFNFKSLSLFHYYIRNRFMNIYTVRLITFSPTHTSKQVGEAIVRGTGISDVARTDLTFHPVGKLEIPENTLTVITVPVYGGKVAPPALERMKDVHASGAPAVLVAVYGNRAYEKHWWSWTHLHRTEGLK